MKITIETARQLYWSGNKEFSEIALSQFTEKEICGDYSLLIFRQWVTVTAANGEKMPILYVQTDGNKIACFTADKEHVSERCYVHLNTVVSISLPTAEEWEQIYQAYPEERPKKQFPKFEELGDLKGYFIDNCSIVRNQSSGFTEFPSSNESNQNIWPSKELAEAALALSQLCQLRDYVNGDWKPEFNNQQRNHSICVNQGVLDSVTSLCHNRVLAFKTPQIRDDFMKAYKELLEIAKPLL